ncbi:MAG: class I SAM-dependent methyltransferase [Treponema sp.]|nr:class I SAM-dependent methyltransferase [Treponema sp.]
MPRQNIYDNETFFEGYRKIRERKENANTLFEIPALFSLIPDLTGKRVLDLGSGFGEHCRSFVEKGAAEVVGIDISEKMLAVARKENADSRIRYLHLPMEELGSLAEERGGTFDVAVSSLALHYVEDFPGVVQNLVRLLADGGFFVFSQEHPLDTCHAGGDRWTRDADGNKLFLNVRRYSIEGERESVWFVDNVKKYHRTFSTIFNTLVENGFTVERMLEPVPSMDFMRTYPDESDLVHKPAFLLLRARKNEAGKTVSGKTGN